MSEESERLAKALIEFREAENISVRELAHRTELSQATIRLHESDRGQPPAPIAARRFEEVLGWAPGSIVPASRDLTDLELPPDSLEAVPDQTQLPSCAVSHPRPERGCSSAGTAEGAPADPA
ncbi:helix-turn-helix transcriptional regulator [Streptomyces sp. RTGN2]|uniref:helix-turn-helix domain-containing protein n=1 Tax=Streptomyces sp. RTGN2 TaxID=3016525 RepID=UPI002555FC58|nr:helix-turn-helix transcriptional regulator [Streptomyces sp. RTGN2]